MLTLVDERTGVRVTEEITLDVLSVGSGGQTVLVLHGVEGVPANRAIIERLGERASVLAPSHPGFDLSPQPSWCDSVDDLAYLYLEWLAGLDAREVVLVGFQFGGWVAAEMAVRSCERLSGLVLVDPVGIKVGGREDRDIADVFAMPRADVAARVFHDAGNAPGDLSVLPRDEVLRIARNEEALVCYGWEPYLHNPRLRRWLRRIGVPTTVVWGAEDGIVSPDYGKAFAAAIPDARFVQLESAGHCPQIERPAELARLIEQVGG